jgi:hypothetical protein
VDYGHPLEILPVLVLVSSLQQRLDGLAVYAGSEFLISETTGQVLGRVHVGMIRLPADHTTERLLAGTLERFWRDT